MLDLDHFKLLNDTWGHAAGDEALLAAGELLLRAAGESKHRHVARMGGEEFALLLSNAGVEDACALAGRLCGEIAALRIQMGEDEIRFTASVGVSALRAGETDWMEMLRRADLAMYKAKQAGRNRWMLCTDALQETLSEDTDETMFARCG